jgi:hypothetical protein
MRDYGKVHTTFWTSSTTRSMSEDARILALYLITSPHSTIAGVFRLPDGYVCEDLQWSVERVAKGFAELLRKGFANRCETTKWAWVCKHLEWNPPENPNQRKSAAKIAQAIPDDCHWKPAFMRDCGPLLDLKWEPSDNPSGTVTEPFLNQEQEQEQEQEQDKESAASQRASRPKKPETTLQTFLETCKAAGVKPIPAEHSIRDYCRDAGITDEMLQVAWCVFRDDYVTGTNKAKRKKDWPGHFANAVRGGWAKLWYTDAGELKWTSQGLLHKKVLDARAKAREEAHAPA